MSTEKEYALERDVKVEKTNTGSMLLHVRGHEGKWVVAGKIGKKAYREIFGASKKGTPVHRIAFQVNDTASGEKWVYRIHPNEVKVYNVTGANGTLSDLEPAYEINEPFPMGFESDGFGYFKRIQEKAKKDDSNFIFAGWVNPYQTVLPLSD